MQTHEFEPMSIGRILDRTFNIYKNNFVRFITIVAIIQVPIALLMTISTTFMQRSIPVREHTGFEQMEQYAEQNPEYIDIEEIRTEFEEASEDEPDATVLILGGIGIAIGGILGILGHNLCRGALTKNVSEFYLGREMTVGQAYRYIWPKFLTLIAAGLLVGIVVWFGFMLLIVPGVIFSLWFALTIPVIVVEDAKVTQGMSRSKFLASGNLGKIFAVGFLVLAISWVVNIPFSFAGGFIGHLLFSNNTILMNFTNQFASVIGQILVVPIGAIAYILLYYDLRIRKEGFDLQMLAESIGSGQGDMNANQPQ